MLFNRNKIYISRQDRENIYNFICMQFKINPITLRAAIKESNIKIDFDFAKRVLVDSNFSEYPSDDYIKSILTEDNIKRLEQNTNVLAMSDFDRKFVLSIFNKSICIGYIDDPRKSFLLGNYPFTPLGGSGLVHPESEHWIIIAPNIAIGLCNPMANMEIINPSVEMIRRMNQQTFDKSSEVVSNSEALLLSVSRNGQTSYRGKYQVKR